MPILRIAAIFSEISYKLFGGNPVITRGSMNIIKSDLRVDSSKARREFDFKPTPLSKTFEDTADWFTNNKIL